MLFKSMKEGGSCFSQWINQPLFNIEICQSKHVIIMRFFVGTLNDLCC